jgi:simple sugar transport system ATP-binding protein
LTSSNERDTVTQVPLVELRNVRKKYGRVAALEDVSLHIYPGEVVGLIGDNGAGKSTIVKIIMGYEKPTSGEVRFDGEPLGFDTPAAARARGIEPVYQDLALIGALSLWRNFFLGREMARFKIGPLRVLNRKEMRTICREALGDLGLTRVRSVEQEAELLSGGERQSLAITRAVHFGARMLLLDEPTASLSVRETEKVLSTVRSAREKNLAVVLIDHNMHHVEPVADRIVVIEHGRVIKVLARGEASVDDLKGFLSRRRPES